MTLAGRLKLSVSLSVMVLGVLGVLIGYLYELVVRGYEQSDAYQRIQITLSQMAGELWQVQQLKLLDARENALQLSNELNMQLRELNAVGVNAGYLDHLSRSNESLRLLLNLYPDELKTASSERLELLNARLNSLQLSMQEEATELRHRMAQTRYGSIQSLIISVSALVLLTMVSAIMFHLHTLQLFKAGMASLKTGIIRAASGDLDSRILEKSPIPEFEELNHQFNLMKQELQVLTISRDELQRVVDSKTQLLKQQTEELKYEAEHDALTGVYSRYAFNSLLEQTLLRLERTGGTGAMLFIDIDKFKPINDNYGHAIGDHVLITIAQRISHTIRKSDMVARIGGDEFLVWLEPIEDALQLNIVISKLLTQLHQDILFQNIHLLIDVSIGVSFYPKDGTKIEELMEIADKNMYACKRGETQSSSLLPKA
ncbi:diguanylate cyclase [Shewanella sp. JM162201]|uniref:Diguanylate cyclase n=1 Tax=Shewanella jiangmenensis TaxID=2837387 RepID=A0ABS5V6T4_9GAMM|nr:GGDEF domain-containing protein [Shewanella jiangmenensis]MBT1445541.1 diguanylate cyclase [Shewanella jiangmenensis]